MKEQKRGKGSAQAKTRRRAHRLVAQLLLFAMLLGGYGAAWILYSKNPGDPEDYKSQIIADTAEGIGQPLGGSGSQALIYYDTRVDQKINTGVYIRNVSEAGESISFDLYLPESLDK